MGIFKHKSLLRMSPVMLCKMTLQSKLVYLWQNFATFCCLQCGKVCWDFYTDVFSSDINVWPLYILLIFLIINLFSIQSLHSYDLPYWIQSPLSWLGWLEMFWGTYYQINLHPILLQSWKMLHFKTSAQFYRHLNSKLLRLVKDIHKVTSFACEMKTDYKIW